MKVKKIAGITFLMAAIAWGCNQSGSGEQENNAYEQSPQEEQSQMPDQSNQESAPFQQQQPQATEVSDKELMQFAVAAQQVQVVNQQVQQKMISAVEEEGLDAQRFNEIQQAQQNPQQEIDVTTEEMEKHQNASQELGKIQGQAQQEMEEKITESGLTMPRYQEIAMSLQSDPELQKKFQVIQQQNN